MERQHKDEKNQLREQNKNTNVLLAERESTLDETLQKLNGMNDGTNSKKTKTASDSNVKEASASLSPEKMITEMQKLMDERFQQMEKNISTVIEKKMEEKEAANTNEVRLSFADALSKNLDTKTQSVVHAIKDSQNSDRVIETERSKREKNIIIHGVHEVNGTDKEMKEEDRSYVVSLLEILGTSATPESITRLGNVTDKEVNHKRPRPIKICMKTLAEKERAMARLANLRNADDKYKRISIKEDYSWEERQRIREWVSKAEEKNKEEQTSD